MSTAPTRPANTVTPHLVCSDASAAIAFYKRAFDAEEVFRLPGANGKGIMHASIRIGNSPVFLVDENPQWGSFGPTSLKGTPVTIHLQVDNVDELYAQAIAAGGTAKMAPADMFWGDRYGVLLDPFGHQWSIATHKNFYTPEQIAENAKAMFGGPNCK
jgi:uncharacterized glyoxalase superfamily protein PhnB